MVQIPKVTKSSEEGRQQGRGGVNGEVSSGAGGEPQDKVLLGSG